MHVLNLLLVTFLSLSLSVCRSLRVDDHPPSEVMALEQCEVSIITAGNPGTGKSHINNLLMRNETFASTFSPALVTTAMQLGFTVLNGKKAAIIDLPAVVGTTPDDKARFELEIKRAFELSPPKKV